MSTALALAEVRDDLTALTLDELAAEIQQVRSRAEIAARSWLDEATHLGELLLAAKAKVPRGEWDSWKIQATGLSRNAVAHYMRIAAHRDLLPPHVTSLNGAARLLRTLPKVEDPRTEILKTEAVKLRSAGRTLREIGDEFGVSPAAVWAWTNPKRRAEYQRKYQRRRRHLEAAGRRVEAAKKIAKIGGDENDAFSTLERVAGVYDRLMRASDSPQKRRHYDRAISAIYRARDEAMQALGLSYGE